MANYGGFDCSIYPGDDAMQAWRDNSSYRFAGYYLPSPCHADSSWTGKYQVLKSMGWGLAVLYVGRQVPGGPCSANTLTRNQGLLDGLDCIAKCQTEGFPQGTIVFLDVEGMDPPVPGEMLDYYRGWISSILDGGLAAPGTYCAAKNAIDLFNAAQAEYAAHNLPGGAPSFWVVKVDPLFDPLTSMPTDCGISFADVWQGRIDVSGETHGGVSFDIDQDAASDWDPSKTSHIETLISRAIRMNYSHSATPDMVSTKTSEIFSSVLTQLARVKDDSEKGERLFFPNGIDSIDVEMSFGLKEPGLSVKISVAGPKKV